MKVNHGGIIVKYPLTKESNRGILDLHSRISYIKSVIRIVGFGHLFLGHLIGAAIILTLAELIGIVEEVVV